MDRETNRQTDTNSDRILHTKELISFVCFCRSTHCTVKKKNQWINKIKNIYIENKTGGWPFRYIELQAIIIMIMTIAIIIMQRLWWKSMLPNMLEVKKK